VQYGYFMIPNKFLNGINKIMNYSLYVHIPFCKHRCHYCDFNTYAGKAALIPAYVDALIKEFRIVSDQNEGLSVHSVYFGGGTPSLIPISLYQKLFKTIKACFMLTDDCEISLESNPATLSFDYLMGLSDIGFNRISMGVQSTDSFDLARLDRIHTINDVLSSFRNARKAGFTNINLDMIFALPWQNLKGWENSLSRAIDLSPEHFSLYSLIIEPGTALHRWYQRGLIATQDQDLEGDMYETSMALMDRAGYEHYEISNWAKEAPEKDFRCRHNLQYWRNKPYLGLGAGSHGYAKAVRTVNTRTIGDYIHRMNQNPTLNFDFPASPATISREEIDNTTQMKDFMMLGLRLVNEGVSSNIFERTYGQSMQVVFKDEIRLLRAQGLLEWVGGGQEHLRLTQRGVMVANQAFMEFV